MAYYNSNTGAPDSSLGMNKKEEDEQSPTGTSAPQLANAAASTSGPTAAGPTAAPLSGNPKAASSGMGGGFQSYQKANQGTATNRLNTAAQSNVANQGAAAQRGISQATSQFGKKVDAGSLANRQQALQDVSNTINNARTMVAAPKPVAAPAAAPAAPAPAQTTSSATLNKSVGGTFAANSQPQVSGGNISPTATPAPAAVPFDIAGADRFKEVINAKYQGPESLRQSGLYQDAAGKVGTAQTTLNQTKTAAGREDMLKDMYSKRGEYNRGLNKLDSAILNSSQSGVKNLQDTAQAQGNLGQQLDKAQLASGNLAQNRTNEIRDIRDQAKNTFTEGQKAERAATDARLSQVVQDWDKLPEYFRDIIRKQEGGGADLNSVEAGILGVQSGEGLYNAGADVIKTAAHDKERLISRDEQARQAALSQLAGLDDSNMLDTNLLYNNADKAGTQSASDALDLAGTRAGLNQAEKGFQDYAENADLTGYGVKKNKSNGKRYYADETANVKDLLSSSGYQFGETEKANLGNADLLKNLSKVSRSSADQDADVLNSPYQNQDVASQLGSLQSDVGSMGVNPLLRQMGINTQIDGANLPMDAATMGVSNVLRNSGIDIPGITNFNVGSIFGGGANTAASKNIASAQAKADLQNKVTRALDSQGFDNRVSVQNNEKTTSRLAALQDLLANMDKTNT